MIISWTIYDHPSDFPDQFVARKWMIACGALLVLDEHFADADLEKVRAHVRRDLKAEGLGAHRFERNASDDPVILEVWM